MATNSASASGPGNMPSIWTVTRLPASSPQAGNRPGLPLNTPMPQKSEQIPFSLKNDQPDLLEVESTTSPGQLRTGQHHPQRTGHDHSGTLHQSRMNFALNHSRWLRLIGLSLPSHPQAASHTTREQFPHLSGRHDRRTTCTIHCRCGHRSRLPSQNHEETTGIGYRPFRLKNSKTTTRDGSTASCAENQDWLVLLRVQSSYRVRHQTCNIKSVSA